jgi:hypothetical protein
VMVMMRPQRLARIAGSAAPAKATALVSNVRTA